MQASMLVLRLAVAARRHDQGAITRVLRALVEHEDNKKRGSIADQLRRLIPRTGADGTDDKALGYLAETTPQISLHDLQLQSAVRRACEELILEQQNAALLASAGMKPRNRILLTGPPGNGKTSVDASRNGHRRGDEPSRDARPRHLAPVPDQAGARTAEHERAGPVLRGALPKGAPPAPRRLHHRRRAGRNELRRSRGVLRRCRTPAGAACPTRTRPASSGNGWPMLS